MSFLRFIIYFIVTLFFISCNSSSEELQFEKFVKYNNTFLEDYYIGMMDRSLAHFNEKEANTFYQAYDKLNKIGNDLNNKGSIDSLGVVIKEFKVNVDSNLYSENIHKIEEKYMLIKSLDNNGEFNETLKTNLFYLIKYEIINYYLMQTDGPCFSFPNHVILPIINSKYSNITDEIDVEIAYGFIDSLSNNNRIFIGKMINGNFDYNNKIDTIFTLNGVANYSFIPKGESDTINGIYEMKTKTGLVYYPFSTIVKTKN